MKTKEQCPRAHISTLSILAVILSLAAVASATERQSRLTAQTFSGLKLRNIGPAQWSGRISDIVKDLTKTSTWYVAVASGNVWKTVNNGTTWTPIFDDYGSYSIGCISIDPKDPKILWLGTGENNSQRSVGYGDGVYKSIDEGTSWKNVGLGQSEHIGKILIDPRDSDVVYAAAQGPLWAEGSTRPPTAERAGNSSSLLVKTQASAILPLIYGIRTSSMLPPINVVATSGRW
jgi:hypothetical protein